MKFDLTNTFRALANMIRDDPTIYTPPLDFVETSMKLIPNKKITRRVRSRSK